jgi:hypothetical protein
MKYNTQFCLVAVGGKYSLNIMIPVPKTALKIDILSPECSSVM